MEKTDAADKMREDGIVSVKNPRRYRVKAVQATVAIGIVDARDSFFASTGCVLGKQVRS
jgi:hypothetical protein